MAAISGRKLISLEYQSDGAEIVVGGMELTKLESKCNVFTHRFQWEGANRECDVTRGKGEHTFESNQQGLASHLHPAQNITSAWEKNLIKIQIS